MSEERFRSKPVDTGQDIFDQVRDHMNRNEGAYAIGGGAVVGGVLGGVLGRKVAGKYFYGDKFKNRAGLAAAGMGASYGAVPLGGAYMLATETPEKRRARAARAHKDLRVRHEK